MKEAIAVPDFYSWSVILPLRLSMDFDDNARMVPTPDHKTWAVVLSRLEKSGCQVRKERGGRFVLWLPHWEEIIFPATIVSGSNLFRERLEVLLDTGRGKVVYACSYWSDFQKFIHVLITALWLLAWPWSSPGVDGSHSPAFFILSLTLAHAVPFLFFHVTFALWKKRVNSLVAPLLRGHASGE